MRALVTGGAGYIGSVVVDLLASTGHEVVVVDNLSAGHHEALRTDVEFHEVSVGNSAAIRALLTGREFDACFHFAGSFDLGASMSTPEIFFANNVGETLALLRTLVECEVPRFVFSSSATVYGEPQYVPIDEAHPNLPVSPYGESKLLVEQALRWLARLGRIRVAALRYFNAAGAAGSRPERHRPETHLIPLALEVAAGERDHLQLYGDDYDTPDGTCIRDYVHVSDLATAHVLAYDALENYETLICNLGSGEGSSNAEVIEAVRRVTGAPVPVQVIERRAGDPARLVAAIDRARVVLGWDPVNSSLDQIVSDAWAARLSLGSDSN